MNTKPIFSYATLGILALVWGSSFILIKKGLLVFTPIQMGGLRMVIAAITLLILCFPFLFKVKKKDVGWMLCVGFFGSGLPSILYPLAQTHVDSAVAGTLNALTPLFTFILGIVLFKVDFSPIKLMGVLLGLLGAITIVVLGNDLSFQNIDYYALYIVVATLCYATSINIIKSKLQNVSSLTISVFSLLSVMPVFLIILYQSGFFEQINFSDTTYTISFASVAVLSIFGTALSSLLFFKLTQETNALFASSVTYLIPFVAVFWGVMDGEVLRFSHLIGMVLILLGVYLVGKKQARN